ncbi:MAG: MBOAT family protein [Opitutae bacterium]|nr:MBOAT family protein [Opitutae bacterium]
MLFNSHEFLFFLLPLVLVGYYLLLPKGWRHGWLVACSYVFYGWWDYRYCGLLLLATLIDYIAGGRIAATADPVRKKRWLCLSICSDMGMLGFFKYYDLGAGTLNAVAHWAGAGAGVLPLLHLILPVGISFYTFQSMSYSIDIYRGHARPAKSFIDFACYVSLFPQLVAGPIVRYHELDNQLRVRSHSWAKAGAGLTLFVLGLAKKVVLADAVAPMADWGFSQAAIGLAGAWSSLMAYTLQIYFDFSGYSDMAVGLGLMLGFQFPQNFHSPYKSASISEFWTRWHISLSSWLRDYLYVPLGGNRKGAVRTYVNLFLTMLLGGLWHGASWTFMLWGAYHGALLALERMNGKRGFGWRLPRPLQVGLTFVLVMFGWVLFRAPTLDGLARMSKGLAGFHGWGNAYPLAEAGALNWAALLFGLALVFAAKNTWEIRWQPSCRWAAGLALLFLICLAVLLVNTSSPFLYFQF